MGGGKGGSGFGGTVGGGNGSATGGANTASSTKFGSGSAYAAAKSGGTHAKFYSQYAEKSSKELEKGVKSINKQIAEHKSKIKNPEKHIPNFKNLDKRHQKDLIEKRWPNDIKRQKEQKNILEGILNERKLANSRILKGTKNDKSQSGYKYSR